MTWLHMDDKWVLVNMSKVCAISEDYIQFDDGHIIFGNVDMEVLATSAIRLTVRDSEVKECTTHT